MNTAPGMKSAQGDDFSDYQPVQTPADFDGLDFAFAKATEDTAWVAQTLRGNEAAMRAVQAKREFFPGFYHFLHPGADPITQAEHFVSVITAVGLKPGDILAVDIEIMTSGVAEGGIRLVAAPRRNDEPITQADLDVTPAQVDACTLAFLGHVRKLVGPSHPLVCYTMHAVGQYLTNTAAKYPLWFAWPENTPPPADMIAPWKEWLIWQWGWDGGNRGDLDAFNGTLADLKAYVGRFLPAPKVRKHELTIVTADGSESLKQLAKSYGAGVAWVISWTFRRIAWKANPGFGRYVLSGRWGSPLPKGTKIAVWHYVEVAK